jgi:hypothetical protein
MSTNIAGFAFLEECPVRKCPASMVRVRVRGTGGVPGSNMISIESASPILMEQVVAGTTTPARVETPDAPCCSLSRT